MQYQLIQDALTSLINCIAISGGAIAGTTIAYKHWMQYQYPQTASEGTLNKSHYNKLSSTDKQLSSKQPEKSYQNKTQLQSLSIAREKQQNQSELCQLQQQLSLTEEQLQQTQQELEQSHQNKLQLQTCLDAVKLELQQAQQKEQQNQSELCQLQQQLSLTEEQLQQTQRKLCQLQQQLSLTEEQLRQTQQELENTKGGLQGFVNQLFYLDRSAKVRFKDLLLNKQLIQVTQPANE